MKLSLVMVKIIEPHGGAAAPFYVSTNVPTKVSNKDFFSAAEPPERSQRSVAARREPKTGRTRRTGRTGRTRQTGQLASAKRSQ